MANNDASIMLDKIAATTVRIPIIGTSPLLTHNFSQKAKRQMLEAQQGKKKIKELRDPQSEYRGSLYYLDRGDGVERYGFPAAGFKKAMVGASRFYGKDLKMTEIRQFVFIHGEVTPADPQGLVEIEGEPSMREDIVRLSGIGRTADLRYRAQFVDWRATLEVTFVTSAFSLDSVVSLIDAAGLGVGVGEWRPEKNGDFGCFTLDKSREIEGV